MSEFTEFLKEVFVDFGPIQARRMFGGHGIYHDGLMFALVDDGTLYLKADDQTQQGFIAAGLSPFVYYKKGKPVSLSFYQAPEEIFDDPEQAVHWAKLAYAAALRAKTKRPKK